MAGSAAAPTESTARPTSAVLHLCGVASPHFRTLCRQVAHHSKLPTFADGWATKFETYKSCAEFDRVLTERYASRGVAGPFPPPPVAWVETIGLSTPDERWWFLGGEHELVAYLEDTSRVPLLPAIRVENHGTDPATVTVWWGDESETEMTAAARQPDEIIGNLDLKTATIAVALRGGNSPATFKMKPSDLRRLSCAKLRSSIRRSKLPLVAEFGAEDGGAEAAAAAAAPGPLESTLDETTRGDDSQQVAPGDSGSGAASLDHDGLEHLTRLDLIQRLRLVSGGTDDLHDVAVSVRLVPDASGGAVGVFVGLDREPRVSISTCAPVASTNSKAVQATARQADAVEAAADATAPLLGTDAAAAADTPVVDKVLTPVHRAAMLFHLDGYGYDEVSKVISEDTEESSAILDAFLRHYNFSGMSIISAMRAMLARFTLLGLEFAKIDRIMQGLASRYVEDVPTVGIPADEVHLLLVSALILNVDLYNPNVVHMSGKMSKASFVQNLEGRKNDYENDGAGEDFPKSLIEGLYVDVYRSEIVQAGIKSSHEKDVFKDRSLLLPYSLRRRTQAKMCAADRVFSVDVGELGVCTISGVVQLTEFEPDMVGNRSMKRRPMQANMMLVGCRIVWHLPHARVDTSKPQECIDKIDGFILIRHVCAYFPNHGADRSHFAIVHGDGREWEVIAKDSAQARQWVARINLMSARRSPPPLSRPVVHYDRGAVAPQPTKTGHSESFLTPIYPECPALEGESDDVKIEWMTHLLHRYTGRVEALAAAVPSAAPAVAGSQGCCCWSHPSIPPDASARQEFAHAVREVKRLHTCIQLLKEGGISAVVDSKPTTPSSAFGPTTHQAMWI